MANFRLVDRDTPYLLPPSVDEWLPEDHLARFVVEITDQLDISTIERQYTGSGSDAYHPRMLLALLFYSYATGTFSSRKIEKASFESVPTRYVAGNQHPDHDTIRTFRRRFLEPIGALFTQILLVAAEMDMVELGDISIDGTRVNANASKHKAMSWKRACRLEDQLSGEVAELLAATEQADEQNENHDTLPEELERREDRLARIQEAKAMIEERAEERYKQEQAEYEQRMAERAGKEQRTGKKIPGRPPKPPEPGPRGKDRAGFTDPESRICPPAKMDGSKPTTPLEAMQWRLQTPEGKDFYGRRKATVETVFGIIKEVMGFRQFLLRGLRKAAGEWNLVQCAYNLKRMHALAG